MELSKHYEPVAVEAKWYAHWLAKKYFNSQPDNRPAFTVVIPPPNVTGVLHMGHTLNETVQDVLVRHARNSGWNACWVPGSDHASIATEAKVFQMLKERGIEKQSVSRPEFLKYAYEWKDKYGSIIYDQIAKLGCSVDWERVTFTMDEHYTQAVQQVFIELYNQQLIYKGVRMIHWDPQAQTALSDEEVEYREVVGTLYYIRYRVYDAQQQPTDQYISIATQRPETIMGDVAVCVHPEDVRFAALKNCFALVPLINKIVPIIFDEVIDKDFGTGALKVTPAHAVEDYNLSLKHQLPVVDTLHADGTLSAAAQLLVGEDRFVAREKIVVLLKEQNMVLKEEQYPTRLGFSQRTNTIVEPRLSTQWFLKMQDLAKPALEAVLNGHIEIFPADKFIATYTHWLSNVRDWCISRQLWWGQQIPVYYAPNGAMVAATSKAAAYEQLKHVLPQIKIEEVVQEADCLDTWFSSWIWPLEVFKGLSEPNNSSIQYYYPTSVLVTGQDILFFWVARMVMIGLYKTGKAPFKKVYFTGMVRDSSGRKMSKSLGNSPDLLSLINQYGADAVRFGILIAAPAGNDLLYSETALEQGRNFNNKLWNVLKLIRIWETRTEASETGQTFAESWFEHRFQQARAELNELYAKFKLNEALKLVYTLIWDDFCGHYLEWVKPKPDQSISLRLVHRTRCFFEQLLLLLHPFMPFITEEIYHLLQPQTDDLCIKQLPQAAPYNTELVHQGRHLIKIIATLREAKATQSIKNKEVVQLYIATQRVHYYQPMMAIIAAQINASEVLYNVLDTPSASISLAIENEQFILAVPETGHRPTQDKNSIEKDLAHQQNQLAQISAKLSNEKFLQNASPQTVLNERKKMADTQARISTLQALL